MSGGDDGQRFDVPVYEMFWDCEYCGANKLLGKTHRHCPQCGAAQNPDKRYFPPEEEKVAVQDHVYFGADWECGSCDSPNSNASAFCGNCGTPKEGAGAVGLAHERNASEPAPPSPPDDADTGGSGGGGGRGGLVFGCIGLLVVGLILFCAVSVFWTRSDTATITGHQWERSIEIQEYQAASDSDWCDEMPSGAYDSRSTQKERETKKVPDGEECETVNVDNGDGTFRQEQECETIYREEAVYDDWCDYKIDKWVDITPVSASGDGLSPVWPETQLRTCTTPRVGCQKEGSKSETYTLTLTDSSGQSQSCSVSESKWRGASDGQQIEISVQVLGGGVTCNL